MTQRWHIPRQLAASFSPLRVPRDPCDELVAWITISRRLEICGSTFVQRFLWRECHGDVEWNASALERIGDDVPAIAKARGASRGRVTEDECKATLGFRKHVLRRMGYAYVAQGLFWDPSTFIYVHWYHPSRRHKVCFHPSTNHQSHMDSMPVLIHPHTDHPRWNQQKLLNFMCIRFVGLLRSLLTGKARS